MMGSHTFLIWFTTPFDNLDKILLSIAVKVVLPGVISPVPPLSL